MGLPFQRGILDFANSGGGGPLLGRTVPPTFVRTTGLARYRGSRLIWDQETHVRSHRRGAVDWMQAPVEAHLFFPLSLLTFFFLVFFSAFDATATSSLQLKSVPCGLWYRFANWRNGELFATSGTFCAVVRPGSESVRCVVWLMPGFGVAANLGFMRQNALVPCMFRRLCFGKDEK